MLCRLNPLATYFPNVACAKLLGRGELKVLSLVFPVCVPPLLCPVRSTHPYLIRPGHPSDPGSPVSQIRDSENSWKPEALLLT